MTTIRGHRPARRAALIEAATAMFARKGVGRTSVDDIVREAGVAKGTFYLYFATKDEAAHAVAERMVDGVVERIEAIATDGSRSPVHRLLGITVAVQEVGGDDEAHDLIERFHRPENRAVHDRAGERAIARLSPVVAGVIADGIAAGVFHGENPEHLAAFILSSLGRLHHLVGRPEELDAATAELNAFILRGLGYAQDGTR